MARKPIQPNGVETDGPGIVTTSDNNVTPVDIIEPSEPEFIAGFESFDPTDTVESGAGADGGNSSRTGKRRGRPPGSGGGRKTGSSSKVHLGGVEKLLYSIHMIAGAAFAPELSINESEARLYAEAINEVSAHYNNYIDPKLMAWVNLVMCAGGIYAPRIMAIKIRLETEAANGDPTKAPKIVNIKPEGSSTKVNGAIKGTGPQTPADIFGLNYTGIISSVE